MDYNLINELGSIFAELLSKTSEYLEKEHDRDVAMEYAKRWNAIIDKYENNIT